MTKAVKLALLFTFMILIPALASDKTEWTQLNVPNEIHTKQELATVPEGWTAAKEARTSSLSAIAVSAGPPENMETLVYDSEVKHKNKSIATWQFKITPKEPIWISCSYSATNIVITKQLPDGIKELRVSYDDEVKTDGLSTVEKIEYR